MRLSGIRLEAHRGAARQCPENTMAAFRCAAAQGYDVIELDLDRTRDGEFIVLHDRTVNRTARLPDGAPLPAETRLAALTYAEAARLDFGVAHDARFRGERIPRFRDVLAWARDVGVRLKIDNKIWQESADFRAKLFDLLQKSGAPVSITAQSVPFAAEARQALPTVPIDYDGPVTEDTLRALRAFLPREDLTVWLPLDCAATHWVKTPRADAENTALVRRYAQLGLWLICSEADFARAAAFAPDIVETDGTIVPIHPAALHDLHTHSHHSHDSRCAVPDMAAAAAAHGLAGFAVTDHCDIAERDRLDLAGNAAASAAEARSVGARAGIEIGEAIRHPDTAAEVLRRTQFDVVLGSVHTVRMAGYDFPYSQIDFGQMDAPTLDAFLRQYFADLLETAQTCDFDVLAHLTCPLRYINGRYGRGVDAHDYADAIHSVLDAVYRRGIALEVNTSGMIPGGAYCVPMPERWILADYYAMGGRMLTLGSDAHTAERCAQAFCETASMLRAIGFRYALDYVDRVPVAYAIPGD